TMTAAPIASAGTQIMMTAGTPTMATITAMMMTMTMMMIKEKTPLRLRHELKYSINALDDLVLAARLGKLFSRDPHAGSHGTYRVSSLYFDTPSDQALRQKISGADRREKFRIRYYGQDTSFIRLEKKIKIHGLCAKYSARLTESQVRLLLQGHIGFLMESENPLLLEFYSKIRGQLLAPKTIVTYEREAFLYPPG